jgi:hypothetical protein
MLERRGECGETAMVEALELGFPRHSGACGSRAVLTITLRSSSSLPFNNDRTIVANARTHQQGIFLVAPSFYLY